MPTASTAKRSTTPRKRRTRKTSTTPLNKSVTKQVVAEVRGTKVSTVPEVAEKVSETPVKSWVQKVRELDGFSLAILPFIYLEAGVKEVLKLANVTV